MRALLLVAVSLMAAGCVANAGPAGFPGTEKNPASGTFIMNLDDKELLPKQGWVKAGTAVTFKDRMGEAHSLVMENQGNATIEVAAGGETVMTWESQRDIRLVCRMHGPDGMRGWLHVV